MVKNKNVTCHKTLWIQMFDTCILTIQENCFSVLTVKRNEQLWHIFNRHHTTVVQLWCSWLLRPGVVKWRWWWWWVWSDECAYRRTPAGNKQVKYYTTPSISLRLTIHAKKEGTQKILNDKDLIFIVHITDVIKLHIWIFDFITNGAHRSSNGGCTNVWYTVEEMDTFYFNIQ